MRTPNLGIPPRRSRYSDSAVSVHRRVRLGIPTWGVPVYRHRGSRSTAKRVSVYREPPTSSELPTFPKRAFFWGPVSRIVAGDGKKLSIMRPPQIVNACVHNLEIREQTVKPFAEVTENESGADVSCGVARQDFARPVSSQPMWQIVYQKNAAISRSNRVNVIQPLRTARLTFSQVISESCDFGVAQKQTSAGDCHGSNHSPCRMIIRSVWASV